MTEAESPKPASRTMRPAARGRIALVFALSALCLPVSGCDNGSGVYTLVHLGADTVPFISHDRFPIILVLAETLTVTDSTVEIARAMEYRRREGTPYNSHPSTLGLRLAAAPDSVVPIKQEPDDPGLLLAREILGTESDVTTEPFRMERTRDGIRIRLVGEPERVYRRGGSGADSSHAARLIAQRAIVDSIVRAAAAEAKWRRDIRDAVVIRNFSWSTSAGGAIMLASFDLANTSLSPVRDIELECALYAPSGTTLSRIQHTLYERLGPGQSISRRQENLGFIHSQAARGGCKVADLVIEAAPPRPSSAPKLDP